MKVTKQIGWVTMMAVLLLFNLHCDAPPEAEGKGSLLLSVMVLPADGSVIQGFQNIEMKIARIEIILKDGLGEGATGQKVLVSNDLQTLNLEPSDEPINVGQFEVPVGFVEQIRLIVSDSISPAVSVSISGGVNSIKLPSGEETGLKIVPEDGVPFEITKDNATAIRATFDPQRQIHKNRGQGFMLKPTLYATAVEVAEVTGGLKPNVVAIRFRPDVSRERIEEINSEIGAGILKNIPELNAYKMRIPNSMAIQDGLNFYDGKPETDRSSPVFIVDVEQAAAGVPNEGVSLHQAIINAPNLWTRLENTDGMVNGTVGNRNIVVAIIDVGFDLDHPDLIQNWYINAAEIPAGLGITDTDGDGEITFIDLNGNANVGQCNVASNVNNPFDICDPLDIINDINWADGVDTDGNGEIDDLVGFDFTGVGDNNPNDVNSHGTHVAGIVGAVGDNLAGGANVFNVDPALDPTGAGISTVVGGIVGMSWRVRILPIRMATGGTAAVGDGDDFDIQEAIIYARDQGADIVNISLGIMSFEGDPPPNPTPTCAQRAIFGGLGKNFGGVRDRANNFYNFNIGNMLIVSSAGNCNVDVPNTNVIVIPKQPLQVNNPNQVIVVASTDTTTTPTGIPTPSLAATSTRGVGYTDLAAPGINWLTLDSGGGTTTVSGTSFASPTVAGAAALILDRNPALIGNGPGLRAAVLNAASATVNLADITPDPTTGNGRFLDLALVP